MPNEIERKFLLKSDKIQDFLFKNIDSIISLSNIEQIYLSEEEDIRIRKRVYFAYNKLGGIKRQYTKYTLTKKVGRGLSREESIEVISSGVYNILKSLGVYEPLIKSRYLFKTGEELDSYDDNVHVMEREFDSVVDSETYMPWFEDIVKSEVTNNLYYSNKQIAKRGGVFG